MNGHATDISPPERGFAVSEFEHRTTRAQALMHEQRMDALFLTTEPEVRYIFPVFTASSGKALLVRGI